MSEIPEPIIDYYAQKARDLPRSSWPDPANETQQLFRELDKAVIEGLRANDKVQHLKREIAARDDNNWTEETISYYIIQTYYH